MTDQTWLMLESSYTFAKNRVHEMGDTIQMAGRYKKGNQPKPRALFHDNRKCSKEKGGNYC